MRLNLQLCEATCVGYVWCFYIGLLLLWWLSGTEFACNAGDMHMISGSGRSPEERSGNPLQYSCLENSRDRGAWWAIVHRVAKSRT